MEINPEILEIFSECKVQKDDGFCYLISLFYNYNPSFIPDVFKQKMEKTGIYITEKGSIKWLIPLFEGQETAFEWVKTEYVKLFKEANSTKGRHEREATSLLKKLFAKNPEIRKEDILGAVRLYIQNTDPRFLMFPHYFIQKGSGADKTVTIMSWLDKYKEKKIVESQIDQRSSITNTMQ